jgi:fatty-acyl-CoA synthase
MPVVHPDERRRTLENMHSPWKSRTLSQQLDDAATRFGDQEFLRTDDESYSYVEIAEWSKRLAGGFVELGIQPGEHVALVMANHPEFVAVKFAISRIGAVCVPINFLLRERELTYVLQQSDVVTLITMDRFRQSNYVEMLDSMMQGWEQNAGGAAFPKLRSVVVFSDSNQTRRWRSLVDVEAMTTPQSAKRLAELDLAADPATCCDILYTSGTTGNPKGVLLTHDMIVRTGYAAAFGRALSRDHRMIFSLPMYHVFGYIECMLAATFAGAVIVARLAFDAADMLAAVTKHQVHEISCVPTMTLALIAEAKAKKYDLSSITTVYSSGGPAPATIWDDIYEVFQPTEVVHGYGQTETTAAMTSVLPEGNAIDLRVSNGRFRNAGCAGDASLGGVLAVYKTVDIESGADLPRGERGELVVRGPAVTSGYYKKPEETQAAFDANGWLRTGDIGIITEDDSLVLVGRVKETYRCGGEMVMPKELENLLMEHPGVSQAHVVGVPHPRMGEVGCAVIVPLDASPADRPGERELLALCTTNLARFKVPAHVLFFRADDIPLTVTGRVQKFRLVELAIARLAEQKTGQSASE